MMAISRARVMRREGTRAGLLDAWKNSVLTDGCADPYAAVLRELALYFGIAEEEARARCLRWEQDSVGEWEERPRDTPDGLLDFYRTQQSWIFDTMWYHAQQCDETLPPESVMIAERLAQMGRDAPGAHLDFGAGPGSTSLFFHRLGWTVALADVSTTMQAFARWRLTRRGVAADYFDTSGSELPSEAYDVITACDVMVHVPDPRETLRRLHRALKVGGLLFFNVDSRPQPSRETQWHLYRYAYPVLRPVRALGFAREPRLRFIHVYRKLPPQPVARGAAVTLMDTLRYNAAVSRVGEGVRAITRLTAHTLAL